VSVKKEKKKKKESSTSDEKQISRMKKLNLVCKMNGLNLN